MTVSTRQQEGGALGAARRARLAQELNRWLPLLIAHEQPDKIILFGSYHTGRLNEWSDLDLVIIKKTRLPFLDRTRQILQLLKPEVGVDVLVYTPEEFEHLTRERAFVRNEILNKGKVLYERSG
jgi:predicted nucleotidyltransferase